MREIFYRVNQYLFFFILLIVVMYFGKAFLVPLTFGALLAMLMAPVCRRFENIGFNRVFATIGCILILVAVLGLVAFVISTQISTFAENLSQIQTKAEELLRQAQAWIEQQIGMSPQEQEEVVKKETEKSTQTGPTLPARILTAIISTLTGIVLTLVIIFLMIFNKEQFETFFLRLYDDQDTEKVKTVVSQISQVSQKYLTGRAMSVLIIASMYSVGLLIVGVKNAVLLGGIAALLTVIPYLGTVLGGLFPVLMALLTQDIQTALMAGVVMISVQTIDNYFIEPNVVGGEVNLNALWSILSIIAGGMIWGVAGMILFLPLFGIIKIICDHVEALRPIGFLMGDPGGKKPSKIKEWIMSKFGNAKKDNL
jgi:predicted PurR-regulated permease PerM